MSGLSGTNRPYDGTTVDALSGTAVLNGLVSGQSLILGNVTSGTVVSANAGSEAITTAITITNGTGGLASNYTLTQPTGLTDTIAPKTVTFSAAKTYDGTNSLTGAVTIATGISGESLTYTGATASDANVATANKYISAITLANGTGGLASNYQLPTLNNANAPVSIAAKTVTLSAAKTYDGTTSLTGAVTINTGIVGQALNYTGATSSDANVATANKYINAITLADGTGGLTSNYQLPTLSYTNAPVTITKAHLTVTANDQTMISGDSLPILTETTSGFVNGESASTAVGFSGLGAATTSATTNTPAGMATIIAGQGSLSAANYDFTNLVNGKLIISPVPPQQPALTNQPSKDAIVAAAENNANSTAPTGNLAGSSDTSSSQKLSDEYTQALKDAIDIGADSTTSQWKSQIIQQMVSEGFTAKDFKQAGFSLDQIVLMDIGENVASSISHSGSGNTAATDYIVTTTDTTIYRLAFGDDDLIAAGYSKADIEAVKKTNSDQSTSVSTTTHKVTNYKR